MLLAFTLAVGVTAQRGWCPTEDPPPPPPPGKPSSFELNHAHADRVIVNGDLYEIISNDGMIESLFNLTTHEVYPVFNEKQVWIDGILYTLTEQSDGTIVLEE